MIKLVKFIIGSLFLVSFLYFLFFVQLGSYTLYQHLRNISNTDEAQELGNGLKQKANFVTSDVVENVPELKAVDDRVKAVKTAVSLTPKKSPSENSSESTTKEVGTSARVVSSRTKTDEVSNDVSNDDRAALDKLLKSKLK